MQNKKKTFSFSRYALKPSYKFTVKPVDKEEKVVLSDRPQSYEEKLANRANQLASKISFRQDLIDLESKLTQSGQLTYSFFDHWKDNECREGVSPVTNTISEAKTTAASFLLRCTSSPSLLENSLAELGFNKDQKAQLNSVIKKLQNFKNIEFDLQEVEVILLLCERSLWQKNTSVLSPEYCCWTDFIWSSELLRTFTLLLRLLEQIPGCQLNFYTCYSFYSEGGLYDDTPIEFDLNYLGIDLAFQNDHTLSAKRVSRYLKQTKNLTPDEARSQDTLQISMLKDWIASKSKRQTIRLDPKQYLINLLDNAGAKLFYDATHFGSNAISNAGLKLNCFLSTASGLGIALLDLNFDISKINSYNNLLTASGIVPVWCLNDEFSGLNLLIQESGGYLLCNPVTTFVDKPIRSAIDYQESLLFSTQQDDFEIPTLGGLLTSRRSLARYFAFGTLEVWGNKEIAVLQIIKASGFPCQSVNAVIGNGVKDQNFCTFPRKGYRKLINRDEFRKTVYKTCYFNLAPVLKNFNGINEAADNEIKQRARWLATNKIEPIL